MRAAPLVAVCLALATPAAAFHRNTPEYVPLTTSGDHTLPRVSPPGTRSLVLALPDDPDTAIIGFLPGKHTPPLQIVAATTGDNANPAVSFRGRSFAWDTDTDPLGNGYPGRQVIVDLKKGKLEQAALDPTGTSANPALGKSGKNLVFESQGDLTGDNPAGTLQVFFRDKRGNLSQLSRGQGTSRNAVISSRGDAVAFESTSHPGTGADTGIAQIWVKGRTEAAGEPVTDGDGPSRNAAISYDGRLVAFESTADLAGGGSDTGIPQIFVWESRNGTFAQITDDAGGCTEPSVNKSIGDWRVTYTCGGQAFYVFLRHAEFHSVDTGGETTRIVMGPGAHFATVATTGDPAGGAPTVGHQVYVLNLWKRPGPLVPGTITWFPFQGLK